MNLRSRHLASLTLLGLGACAAPPMIDDWLTRSPDLIAVNPNDIAVLKVEDASPGGAAAAVVDHMREQIQRELIKRNYAPLRSVAVDAHLGSAPGPGGSIVDAGFLKTIATKAQEDAILAVRIKRWDQTTLMVNNRVRFEVEVALFGSGAGKVLWSGGLRGEVVAGGGKAAPRAPDARARSAADQFVQEIIGRMPRRKI